MNTDKQNPPQPVKALLPCPWCEVSPAIAELPFRWRVACLNPICRIQPKTVKAASLRGAVHFWNHYASTTLAH